MKRRCHSWLKVTEGKTAVITGVGSTASQKATATLRHARPGQPRHDRHQRKGLEATAACRAAGSKVVAFAGDLDEGGNLQCALKEALDAFGKVDFLINYAGGALKVKPIEEMDDEINRRIIDLNLTSTIMSCRSSRRSSSSSRVTAKSSTSPAHAIAVHGPGGRSTRPPRPAREHSRNASTQNCGRTALAVTLLVPGRLQHWLPGSRGERQQVRVGRRTAVRHFADMVYQTCALTRRMRLGDAGLRAGAGRQRT